MRIKIIRGTVAAGAHRVPGEIVEVDAREGKLLLRLGKAEKVPQGAAAAAGRKKATSARAKKREKR